MAGVPVSESELDEVSEELVESESEELAGAAAVGFVSVESLGNCVFGFASAKSSPEIVNEDVKSASLIK